MNAAINNIQIQIENAESRIKNLEDKLGRGPDDMYLADKINYHLGRLSGLRYALLALGGVA